GEAFFSSGGEIFTTDKAFFSAVDEILSNRKSFCSAVDENLSNDKAFFPVDGEILWRRVRFFVCSAVITALPVRGGRPGASVRGREQALLPRRIHQVFACGARIRMAGVLLRGAGIDDVQHLPAAV